MAEVMSDELLMPALLDRLTDDAPANRQEPREMRVMNRSKLRAALLRDLAWLLNATRITDQSEWENYPDAASSVVNYGLSGLAGVTASSVDHLDVENQIRQAILEYEPRILPQTLEVNVVVAGASMDRHNTVSVEIRGSMWCQPAPFDLLLRTDMNLETGEVQLQDLSR